jgi:hypothetical protein
MVNRIKVYTAISDEAFLENNNNNNKIKNGEKRNLLMTPNTTQYDTIENVEGSV